MKEIFIKNKIIFIISFILIIGIIIMFSSILKSSTEYKDIIEYEEFDKNSDSDYNKYNENITESHFELEDSNQEVVVNYNEISGFEQVNVVVNYNDIELTRFEAFSPIVNVIKYNSLFLIFTKENVNTRESVIIINSNGDKLGEIIASDERDIIELDGDTITNKKYVFKEDYPETTEDNGKECGKKEVYKLMDDSFYLESYEYIYCLIDE